MQVVNIHALEIGTDRTRAGPLVDSLASRQDLLWPAGKWPAMRLDRPLCVGARGGHGPIGYTVTDYEPGQRVRFDFDRPAGFDGYHEFRVEGDAGQTVRLVHELRMQTRGTAVVTWPLVFRPLHDALVEDALAHGAANVGSQVQPPEWSRQVRILRALVAFVLGKHRAVSSRAT